MEIDYNIRTGDRRVMIIENIFAFYPITYASAKTIYLVNANIDSNVITIQDGSYTGSSPMPNNNRVVLKQQPPAIASIQK